MGMEAPGAGAAAATRIPMGGDIPPVRAVVDPYPTFNGIAVDPVNDKVVMSDGNRKGILWYDRTAGNRLPTVTQPQCRVMGPDANIGFIAGVGLDPERKEVYVVNNDVEDRVVVFDYAAQGNVKPKRLLYVPHQSWGVALNPSTDEVAFSVQQLGAVMVYRREAKGLEPPQRAIRGPNTGMADTHGIFWDTVHHEIGVTNHGNYAVITPYSAYDPDMHPEFALGGHFREPSVEIFSDTASGDAKPLRVIQGARTQLNWPMGVAVDEVHNEIYVANNGDSSLLVYRRGAEGNVEPSRVIRGRPDCNRH